MLTERAWPVGALGGADQCSVWREVPRSGRGTNLWPPVAPLGALVAPSRRSELVEGPMDRALSRVGAPRAPPPVPRIPMDKGVSRPATGVLFGRHQVGDCYPGRLAAPLAPFGALVRNLTPPTSSRYCWTSAVASSAEQQATAAEASRLAREVTPDELVQELSPGGSLRTR